MRSRRKPDLVDHLVGRARLALPREAQPEIVDHHLHALTGELERVGSAETAARAGDERDLALESFEHAVTPSENWNTF
jgi:hypothetical protein